MDNAEDFRPFLPDLDMLDAFPSPVYFRYIAGLGMPDRVYIGFLAQQIEGTIPEAVTQGWKSPEGEVAPDTRQIDYIPIIAALTHWSKLLRAELLAQGEEMQRLRHIVEKNTGVS